MTTTEWSTSEVARLARVTSRTLRHYDRVGLLRPARVGANGVRWYRDEQLRRLQQILLYRELGLGLGQIAEVLDGQADELAALRQHREWLRAEGRRLQTLASTVDRTIRSLEGTMTMSADELFEGFEERQARWENDLVERYGERVREHVESSKARTAGWTKADFAEAARAWDDLDARFTSALQDGCAVDDPRVVALLDEHLAMIRQHWQPSAEAYAELGNLYVEHADFRARYDNRDPRLAEFLRDAMATYAPTRLPTAPDSAS